MTNRIVDAFENDTHTSANVVALVLTLTACQLWLLFSEYLSAKKILSSVTTRKVVHIGTGLLFLLTWNLFPNNPPSRLYAAIVPLLITFRFALIGMGILKDPKTVASMSRSGDPKELLYGPLMYGVVFIISTATFWADSPTGIVALVLLCVGDGFAFLVGTRYGTTPLISGSTKTREGSAAFFVLSLIAAVIYVGLFAHLGWFTISWGSYFPVLVIVTLAATLVEALPVKEWDNITVFATCLLVSRIFGY